MGGEAFEELWWTGEGLCRIGVASVCAGSDRACLFVRRMVFARSVNVGLSRVVCWCEGSIDTGLEADESVSDSIDESFMMI